MSNAMWWYFVIGGSLLPFITLGILALIESEYQEILRDEKEHPFKAKKCSGDQTISGGLWW